MSMLTSVASATEKHLNIMFAGNMPDIGIQTKGSYTNLAGILDKLRAQDTPTIFAFAGGSLGPSPLSSLDRGSHIIDILNTLEPDFMTLTKREFSYFEDELTLRSYEAAFPIVSSNLYDPLTKSNLEGVLSSLLVEKDDVKIGFISILDEEVVEEYLLQRLRVFEPYQVIQEKVAELKQKGAELVVLIYSKERDYYQTLVSENKIDFAYQVQTIAENTPEQHQSKKVYSIGYNTPFILLRVSWQTNSKDKNLTIKTPKFDYSHIPIKLTTSLLVDEYNHRLNRLLNQNIGFFGSEVQTTRSLIRTMEMPFGNFIADALKLYAKTDIGLINSGVVRGNKTYAKGANITRRDIATELPFRTSVAVLSLTGEQLEQALENSVSEVELEKGRFLQISGMSFTYSIERPVGERIQDVFINGSPLDPKQKYSVATTDYLANGGDGFDEFLDAFRQEQNTQKTPLLSDVVIHLIQQQRTIFPKVEFRIKRVIE